MNPDDTKAIDKARLQFDAISERARFDIYQNVLSHFKKHPGSPWSGAPLRDLETVIRQFYSDLGVKYDGAFRDTLPPLMQTYYDRAVEEMKSAGVRNAVLGTPDSKRIKYFMDSAFEQVAMKTENMSFQHIKALRSLTADVTRQMSITGETRREVSKALLEKALEIPGFEFIDKAGTKWQLKSYFNTLARTELMNAARASYDDKVAEEGFDVMKLTTSGNCCERCARFEGKLFSLTGATPGLPSKQDLIDAGVFHPNCTHSYSLVPDFIRERDYKADGTKKSNANNKTDEEREKQERQKKHLAHRKEQLERAKNNRVEREAKMLGAKLIEGEHSIFEDLRAANPDFANGEEWQYNCPYCIAAYEARRRGIDVKARPLINWNNDPLTASDKWSIVYRNAKIIDCSAHDGESACINVITAMQNMPNGAQCGVQTFWLEGGGHVFIAEKIKGKIVFMDPQPHGRKDQNKFNWSQNSNGKFVHIARLDNLKFSAILRMCVIGDKK